MSPGASLGLWYVHARAVLGVVAHAPARAAARLRVYPWRVGISMVMAVFVAVVLPWATGPRTLALAGAGETPAAAALARWLAAGPRFMSGARGAAGADGHVAATAVPSWFYAVFIVLSAMKSFASTAM